MLYRARKHLMEDQELRFGARVARKMCSEFRAQGYLGPGISQAPKKQPVQALLINRLVLCAVFGPKLKLHCERVLQRSRNKDYGVLARHLEPKNHQP